MEGACDFSRLAKFIEAQRRTGGYLLAEWSFHSPKNLRLECGAPGVPAGAPLEFMSGPWRRAFHSLLTQMNSHLESRGVPRDRILHYIFDEYLGDKFIQTGRLIRQINPEYKIFGDLSADLDTYQKAAPYVDIWCPHFSSLELMDRDGRLEFLRSTGKPIWCYDEGYNQRASDPRAKFRRKFWIAFRYKLDGCAYWKHQGDSVGTAYYPVRGQQPVTSRRYEEWCSGLQDYKLLKMLEKQTEPDSPRAVEAGKLMREAVAEVIAHPEQASLADKYRERILIFLSETGTP
jgi:hypothetical protein